MICMKKKTLLLGALGLACLTSSASAQYVEDFESLTLGQLDGQGGWHGWGAINTTWANVSADQNNTPAGSQSAKLETGADSVKEFQHTSGKWTVKADVFVPTGFSGKTWFLLLNQYSDPGPWQWSMQMGFNGSTGMMECECGVLTTDPLVLDQWVDIRFEVDLDGDSVQAFYNTAVNPNAIATWAWSSGSFGADAFTSNSLACIDLYPDPAALGAVYYDNIEVIAGFPGGSVGTAYCFGDGSGTACTCGNTGGATTGCANSAGAGGEIGAFGSDSVSSDDLVVSAAGLIPGQPALLFSGDNAVNGGNGILFGDGLRCAGGNVVRLGVKVPDANGDATWGPGLVATSGGAWVGGNVRRLQGWYRDPAGPCGSAFNLTNGLEVTWSN
jgi:hypothetical protein